MSAGPNVSASTGSYNTAIGNGSLLSNTTGQVNTAVGYQALYSNNTASDNEAFGYRAMYSSTTGTFNTAIGGQSLYDNTTGDQNVAVGYLALTNNTTSNQNTAIGSYALHNQTTATTGQNVALGHKAGYTTNSYYNTFLGYKAGEVSTGYRNTFVGHGSGISMTTGQNNTILGNYNGNQDGLDIRTSSNNIVLSDGDGNWRIYTTSVGDTRGGQTPNYRGASDDGYGSWQLGSNGNLVAATYADIALIINRMGSDGVVASIRNSGSQVGTISVSGSSTAYNTSSDYRLKENVVYDWDATTRLKQLKPARFNFIADADTTVDGFLAHEVQDIVPEAITGTKDAVDADGNPVYQGIDQSKLVPLLVATIQELEARITALEAV
jgi:hypothetical protein